MVLAHATGQLSCLRVHPKLNPGQQIAIKAEETRCSGPERWENQSEFGVAAAPMRRNAYSAENHH